MWGKVASQSNDELEKSVAIGGKHSSAFDIYRMTVDVDSTDKTDDGETSGSRKGEHQQSAKQVTVSSWRQQHGKEYNKPGWSKSDLSSPPESDKEDIKFLIDHAEVILKEGNRSPVLHLSL